MAILGARSWECGNTMLNAADNSLANVSSTQHHTGAYCLQLDTGAPGDGWARWAIEGMPLSPSVSVWMYLSSMWDNTGGSRIQFVLTPSGLVVELRWNAVSHTYDAYINGSLAKAGTITVAANTWFHVQFYAVIADAGNIGVKIDGHQSIDWPCDTLPGAETGVSYVKIISSVDWVNSYFVDDLVWGSGGYLGDLRCIDIRPTADTAVDDWTPSSGDNYSTIDETPPSDADYNETNTNAQADELALGDFDGVTYTPVAITAWARAWMLAATGDSLKVGIDSGGVDDVTQSALATAVEYLFHTADQNPDGPAAWDDAAIDALLYRYESVIA